MRTSSLLLALLITACHPQGSGAEPGAADPRAAVEAFLAGARSQDLQAMAQVWGNERGPATRQMDRREHEMRLLTMMCHYNHQRARVLSETPGQTQRSLVVELSLGQLTGRATFTTVPGPRGRWYVLDAPLANLGAFCRSSASAPAPSR